MSQDAREWLGLIVVLIAGVAFVSLLIWIQAQSHGKSREQILRTIALVWAATALTVAAGWMLRLQLGGPVFELQPFGGLRLLVRSLSGPQIAMTCALLAALVGLYIGVILAVRRLLGAEPTGGGQITVHPAARGDKQ